MTEQPTGGRGRGRPPKPQTRTAEVHLRLTPAELAAIDRARGDQDRNAWIRDIIKERLERGKAT
jgi:hypothetical protein